MDNIIIKAMTDIDERFILEAADEEHIREVFSKLTDEDGFTADDFVNTGEIEETDSDTTAEENQSKRKSTKRTHKVSFKKILLVAVISVLLFAVATTGSAYVFDFNIKEELVEFFDDHLRLHLDKVDSTADSYSLLGTHLAKELEENGISPVTLPAALLTEEWKIGDIHYQQYDESTSAGFYFEKSNMTVTTHIIKYYSDEYVPEKNISFPQKATQLKINNMDVIIIKTINAYVVSYRDNLITYTIMFKCSYETTLDIVNTIM